jgi:hypothetical protein
MDDEDPVDLKPQIEEAARPLCAKVCYFNAESRIRFRFARTRVLRAFLRAALAKIPPHLANFSAM